MLVRWVVKGPKGVATRVFSLMFIIDSFTSANIFVVLYNHTLTIV